MNRVNLRFLRIFFGILLFFTFAYCEEELEPYERDVPVEEYLENVKATRQKLLYEVNGIKIPKPKDYREGFYGLFNVGLAHSTTLGVNGLLGVEVGYDIIFAKRHSLRIFGFFDRTTNQSFDDINFDKNKANNFQLYRAGLSAEYRIYASKYVGFKLRLASAGIYEVSHTPAIIDTNKDYTKRTRGIYPTFAAGVFFYYGRHHEIFVGYDLLDYERDRGMNVNYLRYSLRF